jgi:hypothetical protein
METTSPTTSTSSGDASSSPTVSERVSGAFGASVDEGPDLLRADGSLIPVTREADEAPRREPPASPAMLLRAWRSRTAERLAAASPSEIALSAFGLGLVAGVFLGVASARR